MNHFHKIYSSLLNITLPVIIFITVFQSHAQEQRAVIPFEKESGLTTTAPIDIWVQSKLRQKKIKPSNLCSDGIFIRRVYLDVIGTLPEPKEINDFLRDTRPDKRALLIDTLLERDEFADYWTLKWCDLFRVKAEFPVNLWPNAVQTYHHWIHDSIRKNKPYNIFVLELLTSSGSNFRDPPVNFYRAVQSKDSTTIAAAIALAFMGTRLEKWQESRRTGMAAFFSRVGYKYTGEWKEEIVYSNLSSTTPLVGVFPDGNKIQISPDQDPRLIFTDWLVSPKNPWFARNIVNRIWFWLIGRGIIHEPDDIYPDNPPVNPELLAYLEKELVKSNYDLKHIYRIILNSRTYQQSSLSQDYNPESDKLFAHYLVRRLDAENLIDALDWIGGTGESYISMIPEPYTNIPEYNRTISLADGSITSQFLEMFGRPPRDTGLESERNNESSDSQRLYLLNSTEIQNKIEKSIRLRRIYDNNKKNIPDLIHMIYITILSRNPTIQETNIAEKYFQTTGINQKQAADDLAWALINTKEFLYRH